MNLLRKNDNMQRCWSYKVVFSFLKNKINMIQIITPNISHKEKYEVMKKSWETIENIPTNPKALFLGENFQEFLELLEKDILKNRFLYFALNENWDIIWWIQIRTWFDEKSNIWYGIHPDFRWNWFATKLLELWLNEAKNIGLNRAILTCDQNNIPSNKVIQKNGWVLVENYFDEWVECCRYKIEL